MSGLRIGSLFSGYGGLDLGVRAVLGGDVAWHSDIDKGACKILAHHWPDVPNLGDITAVDWTTVEPVDVLTGGFPCQDVSHAGKRAGLNDTTRSGLWGQMARAIDELRPALVVAENVRGLLSANAASDVEPCPLCVGDDADGALRALGAVLGDLADLGYDAEWTGLRAADVGAPHGRFRVFIVAHPAGDPWRFGDRDGSAAAVADSLGSERGRVAWGRGHGPANDCCHVADAASDGRDQGRPEPAGLVGRLDAALSGDAPAPDAECCGRDRGPCDKVRGAVGRAAAAGRSGVDWGVYEPAVRRWEHVTGRPAPVPTEPGSKSGRRLSPAFVEWMMGLPAGHVTAVPGLTRNDQLKALGNGVVPMQAAAALSWLLDVAERVA